MKYIHVHDHTIWLIVLYHPQLWCRCLMLSSYDYQYHNNYLKAWSTTTVVWLFFCHNCVCTFTQLILFCNKLDMRTVVEKCQGKQLQSNPMVINFFFSFLVILNSKPFPLSLPLSRPSIVLVISNSRYFELFFFYPEFKMEGLLYQCFRKLPFLPKWASSVLPFK